MNTSEILDLVGDFTWCFGNEFFIETPEGNFIWSDPDYNGDNTLTQTSMTWPQYRKSIKLPYGRDKGKHTIRSYCGDDVIIIRV